MRANTWSGRPYGVRSKGRWRLALGGCSWSDRAEDVGSLLCLPQVPSSPLTRRSSPRSANEGAVPRAPTNQRAGPWNRQPGVAQSLAVVCRKETYRPHPIAGNSFRDDDGTLSGGTLTTVPPLPPQASSNGQRADNKVDRRAGALPVRDAHGILDLGSPGAWVEMRTGAPCVTRLATRLTAPSNCPILIREMPLGVSEPSRLILPNQAMRRVSFVLYPPSPT